MSNEMYTMKKRGEEDTYVLSDKAKELIHRMLFGEYEPEWFNSDGVVENSDRAIAERLGVPTRVVRNFTTRLSNEREAYFNQLLSEGKSQPQICELLLLFDYRFTS